MSLRLVLLVSLALVACEGAPVPAVDAAMPADASTVCGSLAAGRPAVLPSTCLPRCTAATLDAYAACGNDMTCIMQTLGADPTPPARVSFGGAPYLIGCGRSAGEDYACTQWQDLAVSASLCPDVFDAWASCISTGAACQAESNAILSCGHADSRFNAMFRTAVLMCFASP